jgi:transcriptional regulator GlxA family with amidase domain
MTKTAPQLSRVEVGLVCDEGSSHSGIHGLTDLFNYAGQFAAAKFGANAESAIRIAHWSVQEGTADMCCTYDSRPLLPHKPAVLVLPGNERATAGAPHDGPLSRWLRQQHAQGVVLAAVCGGVFILARSGLLAHRQATTHWALRDQFAAQFPDVLTETDRMLIDYGEF